MRIGHAVAYVFAWQPLLFLLPDGLVQMESARVLVDMISAMVPSIHAYAINSPEPARVGLFFATQWCAFPIYLYMAFRCWGRVTPDDIPPDNRLNPVQALLGTIGCLLVAWATAFLPDDIAVDPNPVRPNRVWKHLMHEYLLPNGLMAVILPPSAALMVTVAWLCWKFIFATPSERI